MSYVFALLFIIVIMPILSILGYATELGALTFMAMITLLVSARALDKVTQVRNFCERIVDLAEAEVNKEEK